MSFEKDWVDITSALLTPVVAILGIAIAILQWRLNRARFRHELFEKRYRIFDAAQLYISQVASTAKMDDANRIEFLRTTRGAFAIYSGKVLAYLDEIHRKSTELHLYQQREDHERETEILKWFSQQLLDIKSVFQKELKVD